MNILIGQLSSLLAFRLRFVACHLFIIFQKNELSMFIILNVCRDYSEGQLTKITSGSSWPNSGGYITQYLFFSSVCKQIF